MTKQERANQACPQCAIGTPRSFWQGQWKHDWVKPQGQNAQQYSTQICQADAIWKEPDDA